MPIMIEMDIINEERLIGAPLVTDDIKVEDQRIQMEESSDSSDDEVDLITFDKLPAGKLNPESIDKSSTLWKKFNFENNGKLSTLGRKQTTTFDQVDHKRPAGDSFKLRNSKSCINPMVWEDKDIPKDGSQMYENKLKTLEIDVISRELILLCRKKLPNRLSTMCEHINNYRKMKLHEDVFCGEIYNETPLHVAIMSNNDTNASILVKYGGKDLIFRPYKDELYFGINSLHLAIIKNMQDLICNILDSLNDEDRNHLLHLETTCDFITKKLKTSGLPLTLAAWCGKKEIINDLVKYGAQLDKKEMSTGNNIFHSLVKFSSYCNKKQILDTFEYIVESDFFHEWVTNELKKENNTVTLLAIMAMKKYILEQKNVCGQSVLQLACSKGEICIIQYVLNISDVYLFPQWECGPVSLKFYDVSSLSSRDLDRKGTSGLEYLSYGTNEENIDILVSEPVKSLIDVKWNQFKWWIVAECMIHIFMMCILTSFVIYQGHDEKTKATLASFIVTYCLLIMLQDLFYIMNSIREICSKKENVLSEKLNISNILFNFEVNRLIFAVSSIFYFTASYFSQAFTNEILAVAAVSGWFYCVYFTSGFKSFGYFQAMMRKMLLSNLRNFLALYVIILIAFSTAFFSIENKKELDENVVHMSNFIQTIFILIRQSLGVVDMGEEAYSSTTISPWMHKCLMILFLFLSMILLLNMVIATMTDTYSELSRKKEAFWYKLSLNTITKLERKLPRMLIPKANLLEYKVEEGNEKSHTILLLEEKSANLKKLQF